MRFLKLLTPTLLAACSSAGANEPLPNSTNSKPNILLIIADDIGKDALSIYDSSSARQTAKTPQIDALAKRGVLFDNFWTSSLSSPTRAMLITGKYGFRTEVLTTTPIMSRSERTIQKEISDSHSNAIFGKWHLSHKLSRPEDYGIDHFAGYMGGGVSSYTDWISLTNGIANNETEYASTQITSWAKEWIESQNEPWFCWVAYPSAHTPYHNPPNSILPDYTEGANKLPYFIEMIEALDLEIGRLLESVDLDNTVVIFLGDNGTAGEVYQGDSPGGKGSSYQGGINNPLIIAGAGVTRKNTTDTNLINATDIFPTIAELSGKSLSQYKDGYSIKPLLSKEWNTPREYLFTDYVGRRDGYRNVISDGRYKLVSVKGNETEFYDLLNDPNEQNNIISSPPKELQRLKNIVDSFDIPQSVLDTEMVTRRKNSMSTSSRSGREIHKKTRLRR